MTSPDVILKRFYKSYADQEWERWLADPSDLTYGEWVEAETTDLMRWANNETERIHGRFVEFPFDLG